MFGGVPSTFRVAAGRPFSGRPRPSARRRRRRPPRPSSRRRRPRRRCQHHPPHQRRPRRRRWKSPSTVLRPRRAAAPSRARASSERRHHQRRACPSWTRSSRSSQRRRRDPLPRNDDRRPAPAINVDYATASRPHDSALFSCAGAAVGAACRGPSASSARPESRSCGAAPSWRRPSRGAGAVVCDAAPYGRAPAAGGCGSARTGRA